MEVFLQNLLEQLQYYINTYGFVIIKKTFFGLVIFFIGYLLINHISNRIKRKIKNNLLLHENYVIKISSLVANMIFFGLMIFNVLIVFSFLGFNLAIVIGGLSVGIGFALETTIKNMISGIFLITNKKFKYGEFVDIKGKLQLKGYVSNINLRYTTIKTLDKRKFLIPNSKLIETAIFVYRSEPISRGELVFDLPRYVDLPQVKKIIKETIIDTRKTFFSNYINTIVSGFNEYGIQLKSYFYFDPKIAIATFLVNSTLRKELSKKFKKYGINVGYKNIEVNIENI